MSEKQPSGGDGGKIWRPSTLGDYMQAAAPEFYEPTGIFIEDGKEKGLDDLDLLYEYVRSAISISHDLLRDSRKDQELIQSIELDY